MKSKNTLTWSSIEETNQVIESTKAIKIIEQSKWKEAGLNKEPVALKTKFNEQTTVYYLNYFAVIAIQNRSDIPWKIPSATAWNEAKNLAVLKDNFLGDISPLGKTQNKAFSNGFWTQEKQGENHAFFALLTNLNDKIYFRSDVLTCGFFLRLVKEVRK